MGVAVLQRLGLYSRGAALVKKNIPRHRKKAYSPKMQRSVRRAKIKVVAMAVTSLAVVISRHCQTNLIGEQRLVDDTASSPFWKLKIKGTSVASGYQ